MTNAEIEQKILDRCKFHHKESSTFDSLMKMLGFEHGRRQELALGVHVPESRILDQALQRLRKRGAIYFSKTSREWVTS